MPGLAAATVLQFAALVQPVSQLYGLLPKSLFALSKTFLINLKLVPGALKTRPSGSDSSKR
jgi:hypothetical protein